MSLYERATEALRFGQPSCLRRLGLPAAPGMNPRYVGSPAAPG